MGLFSKNDIKEFKDLEGYCTSLDSLLLKDSFISRKDYLEESRKLDETYNKLSLMDKENVLVAWCKQNLDSLYLSLNAC